MFAAIQSRLATWPSSTALALGAFSATGFAPLGLWPVTLITFALLMESVRSAPTRGGALARGYWFGVGHFTIGLNWIAGSFAYQDKMPVWLGWIAVVVLSLYLAVYPALAAGLAWRFGRDRLLAFVIAFAGFWTITEWLRATMFTGFAWNPLGVVTVPMGALPQAATWIGTYGLSALTILIAGGLMLALERRWTWAALMLAPLLTAVLPKSIAVTSTGRDRPLIRVIQPNIGQQDKYRDGYERINFAKLASLTGKPGREPRLILWPEAAIPDFLEVEEWARMRIAGLIGPRDVVMTGANALIYDKNDNLTGAHNSVFVVRPDAKLGGRYDKAHLVPYGEYLPMRPILSAIGLSRLVPGDIDFIPGPGAQSMAVPGFGKVGVQICYEIIFAGETVDRANRPDMIFNPSNDAWFGPWGPPQHLAQARLRAIEEGLPVVRSTPTGISAVIDANGVILKSLPYRQAGFIETRLPGAHAPTLFSRAGNILSLALGFFLGLLGIALGRQRR